MHGKLKVSFVRKPEIVEREQPEKLFDVEWLRVLDKHLHVNPDTFYRCCRWLFILKQKPY
jgi:hypothetical protein